MTNQKYKVGRKKPVNVTQKGVVSVKYVQPEKKRDFGPAFYGLRYKYGYNWAAYDGLARKLIEMMQMSGARGMNILDVGCGICWLTDFIYFNVSRKTKGIDYCPTAIWKAKAQFPCVSPEIADAFTYDFSGYDAFVMTEILEHVEDDIGLLKRIPKGARVYGSVPYEKMRQDVCHVREYDIESLRNRYGSLFDIKAAIKVDAFILFWGVRK